MTMIKTKGANKILKIANYIAFGIFAIAEIALIIMLLCTSFLPLNFFCLAVLVLCVVTLIFAFGAYMGGNIAIAICLFLELLGSIGLGIVLNYLFSTQSFLDGIQSTNYKTEEYLVVVKKDSAFEVVEDLKDKTIATYTENWENYQTAVSELSGMVDAKITNYDDAIEASSALLESEVDAVLLKGSIRMTVSEIIPKWNDENIRILYTIKIQTETVSYDRNINVSEEPFSILISGIDTYGDISTVSRSDVNMIMAINPKTHKILLTSIPRDFYVQLHGTTGSKDKLTHSGIYGIDMTRTTLEDLFGIDIDYSVRVNFNTLVNLVDIIGGITITPDTTFKASGCYFTKDEAAMLNGKCALAYSRERHAYSSGDRHRVQNQQDVLEAIIAKMTSSKTLISRYFDILDSISGSIETTIPASQFYKLANLQLADMPQWTIGKVSVNGYGDYNVTYSMGSRLLYVMVPYEDTIEKAKTEMGKILHGADLDAEDNTADANDNEDYD